MDGWNYAKESGHLSYAADEPYLGIDMHCDPDVLDLPNALQGYKVTDWERVCSQSSNNFSTFLVKMTSLLY